MKVKTLYLGAIGALVFLSACTEPKPTPAYTVEKIGAASLPADVIFRPRAINNDGTVVGIGTIMGVPVIFENGGFVERPDLLDIPWDISHNGIIVGGGFNNAYLNDGGNNTLLSDLFDLSQYNFSSLFGVNNHGTAIGALDIGEQGFIFENGELLPVNICGTALPYVFPSDINDNGTVVGYCAEAIGSPAEKGFARYNGEFSFLSVGDVDLHMPMGINENDVVVGSFRDENGNYHGFKYNLATQELFDLGMLDEPFWMKINDNGITIISDRLNGYVHADGEGLKSLTELVAPHDWRSFREIIGINNDGLIVGFGSDAEDNLAGFFLKPMPGTAYAGTR